MQGRQRVWVLLRSGRGRRRVASARNAKGRRCEEEGSPMQGRRSVTDVRRVETMNEATGMWVGSDAVGTMRWICDDNGDGKTRATVRRGGGDDEMVWHWVSEGKSVK